MGRLQKLSEDTAVSIGVVAILMGVAYWVSTLVSNQEVNARDISELKAAQVEYNKSAQRIDRRLGRIEERLKIQDER